MKISIFEGDEQVEYIALPGDVSDYDIIINSSSPVEFPPQRYEGDPPEIPDINPDDIPADANRKTYIRMRDSPESLAADIRRILYQWHISTRKQLDEWLRTEGYSTRSGAVRESLIVLEDYTDEINRIGEGDEMEIIWTGKT